MELAVDGFLSEISEDAHVWGIVEDVHISLPLRN